MLCDLLLIMLKLAVKRKKKIAIQKKTSIEYINWMRWEYLRGCNIEIHQNILSLVLKQHTNVLNLK